MRSTKDTESNNSADKNKGCCLIKFSASQGGRQLAKHKNAWACRKKQSIFPQCLGHFADRDQTAASGEIAIANMLHRTYLDSADFAFARCRGASSMQSVVRSWTFAP
eukprot:1307524-Amphidinium_carterae.1